ncbi:hypothetical protein [Maribacter sp. Hel_I_7]|uniref:hypothetical protein n=1 Tax=Maribacter sp. Hel_I_7 TaxID=1249997 RepID=UPI00047915F0|nr:hypothetical protein [Maribacter sp. Hel_I_7]
MKDKVLAFLKDGSGVPEERYNEAMALLQKSEGKSVAQVNSYYRSGFTETNLKNICYDLQQLHGVSDVEMASSKNKKPKVQSTKSDDGDSLDAVLALVPDEIKAIVVFIANMPAGDYPAETKVLFKPLSEFVEKHKAVFLMPDKTPMSEEEIFKTIYVSIADWKDENNLVNAFADKITGIIQEQSGPGSAGSIDLANTLNKSADILNNDTYVAKNGTNSLISELESASEEVKSGLKVRERFAFLGETDCPDKFKILINDFFTALDAFKAGHAALLIVTEEGKDNRTLTDAEIYAIGKETIDAFQLKQSIWDELEFYNEHKEVLGNHPIFADDQLKEKVAAMSDVDLVNRQKNVRSYISKENKKLKSAKDEAAATKIKGKIQELNQELNLLDERIGKKK